MAEADRFQLLYYLYELNRKGIGAIGVINYPLLRKIVRIVPTDDDFRKMRGVLQRMRDIVTGPFVEPHYKRICRKCAYYDFCFG